MQILIYFLRTPTLPPMVLCPEYYIDLNHNQDQPDRPISNKKTAKHRKYKDLVYNLTIIQSSKSK